VLLTGDEWRCPPEARDAAPPNVRFMGYRSGAAYRDLVAGASVLLVLTTDPASVPRSALEAVEARRPLILSDHPELRELFPGAVFVGPGPEAIAAGIRAAVERHDALVADADRCAAVQARRFEQQRAELLRLLAEAG
jgi:glycosyltransferase involved in cell wall biosynthesis